MMKIAAALTVLGLIGSGSAYANEKSQTTTTTTTERKADGDGTTTTIETKSKSDGAAGKTTRDEKLTLEKHVKPDGSTVTRKDVKTSHKSDASPDTHKTDVEEKTVRDGQGKVIEYEKTAK